MIFTYVKNLKKEERKKEIRGNKREKMKKQFSHTVYKTNHHIYTKGTMVQRRVTT
jgi:hypothetical protein